MKWQTIVDTESINLPSKLLEKISTEQILISETDKGFLLTPFRERQIKKIKNQREAIKTLRELILTMKTLEQLMEIAGFIADFKIRGCVFITGIGDGCEFDYIKVNQDTCTINFMVKSSAEEHALDEIYYELDLKYMLSFYTQISPDLCEITVYFPTEMVIFALAI